MRNTTLNSAANRATRSASRRPTEHASLYLLLSPVQRQVVDAIATGATITAAASSAGVHRNTVTNWLALPFFRAALQQAHIDQELCWREQAEMRARHAFQVMDEILANPNASPTVRRGIAKDYVEWASCPLALPQVQSPSRAEDEASAEDEVLDDDEPGAEDGPVEDENPSEMHISAHPGTKPAPGPGDQGSPVHREGPKIGRNDQCPCGSGRKFKRCCLGKTSAEPDSAAAA